MLRESVAPGEHAHWTDFWLRPPLVCFLQEMHPVFQDDCLSGSHGFLRVGCFSLSYRRPMGECHVEGINSQQGATKSSQMLLDLNKAVEVR